MYQRIREQFSPTAMVLSVIAIVLALTGGAIAASKYVTKKEAEKIAKKYAGKPGTNGTNGTNGTPGEKGAPGTNGTDGTNGTSAEAIAFTGSKGTCTENQGGLEVKSASGTTYLCNGKKGTNGAPGESVTVQTLNQGECANGEAGAKFTAGAAEAEACDGKEGSPWTHGGVLPTGQSEQGDWSIYFTAVAEPEGPEPLHQNASSPISFGIPLANAPTPHYLTKGFPTANKQACEALSEPEKHECEETLEREEQACPGTAESPAAAPGNLCVFASESQNLEPVSGLVKFWNPEGNGIIGRLNKAGKAGTLILMQSKEKGSVSAYGDWAVTAG